MTITLATTTASAIAADLPTGTRYKLTETAVIHPPNRFTGAERILITEAMSPERPLPASMIGAVVTARSDQHNDWHEYGQWLYKGALVNPAPENGKHYRMLEADGQGLLLRYNDEDHRADRNGSGESGWSIVAGPEGDWAFPNDSLAGAPMHYVEVDHDPNAVSVDRQETIENADGWPTFGGAETTIEGDVLLKPEPVVGQKYLIWRDEADTTYVGTFVGTVGGAPTAQCEGRIVNVNGETVGTGADHRVLFNDAERNWKWAKAALVKPEPETVDITAESQKLTTLRAQVTALQVEFETMNENLNETAEEKGWCPEYEEIVEPLGMTGRQRETDWDVEIRADITLEDDSPNSRVNSDLGSLIGMDFECESYEIKGSVTVTITRTARSGGDASNGIESDDVRSAVYNELSSHVDRSFTIDDWNVIDTTES